MRRKRGPCTEADLIAWYREGVPLCTIFMRAYVGNKWGRGKVREVIGI